MAHTFACLRIAEAISGTGARLATGSGGLTLGRAGFAPAGRQTKFHEGIVSSFPFDQHCLVALNFLSAKRAVGKQGQRRSREQRQLTALAQQQRLQAYGAARMAEQVEAMLELVSPRQRSLLAWYAQGYSDAEVAGWLTTTPQAVRVARQGAYRALRTQLCPPTHLPQAQGSSTSAS
jgi:hypothetical protein